LLLVLSFGCTDKSVELRKLFQISLFEFLFNPLPDAIAYQCPNLNVGVNWGSYYLEDVYFNEDEM